MVFYWCMTVSESLHAKYGLLKICIMLELWPMVSTNATKESWMVYDDSHQVKSVNC